ncbi:hypothetical protein [Agromyces sp. SYSU T00266]|uniref:hypothetical protein n=1 Tax=Agromyces zhanjiangensis TaxID=3158562 RepID=UPI003398760C
MTVRLHRAVAATSAAIALTLGIAGCASGQDPSNDVTGLRAQVVSIAESSSAGDFADALARLDALQAEVDAAEADGDLDADRAAGITEAISLVRADLEAAIAAASPSPSPTPTETADEEDDDSADDPGNSGSGNSDDKPGKGKGRDKGKGDD